MISDSSIAAIIIVMLVTILLLHSLKWFVIVFYGRNCSSERWLIMRKVKEKKCINVGTVVLLVALLMTWSVICLMFIWMRPTACLQETMLGKTMRYRKASTSHYLAVSSINLFIKSTVLSVFAVAGCRRVIKVKLQVMIDILLYRQVVSQLHILYCQLFWQITEFKSCKFFLG